MNDEPLDLHPLALSELSRERIARRVLSRARPAGARGPMGVLAGWLRPGLAAAAAIGAVSVGALAWTPASGGDAGAPLTIADGLSIPGPAADWIAEDRPPAEADLLESWEP